MPKLLDLLNSKECVSNFEMLEGLSEILEEMRLARSSFETIAERAAFHFKGLSPSDQDEHVELLLDWIASYKPFSCVYYEKYPLTFFISLAKGWYPYLSNGNRNMLLNFMDSMIPSLGYDHELATSTSSFSNLLGNYAEAVEFYYYFLSRQRLHINTVIDTMANCFFVAFDLDSLSFGQYKSIFSIAKSILKQPRAYESGTVTHNFNVTLGGLVSIVKRLPDNTRLDNGDYKTLLTYLSVFARELNDLVKQCKINPYTSPYKSEFFFLFDELANVSVKTGIPLNMTVQEMDSESSTQMVNLALRCTERNVRGSAFVNVSSTEDGGFSRVRTYPVHYNAIDKSYLSRAGIEISSGVCHGILLVANDHIFRRYFEKRFPHSKETWHLLSQVLINATVNLARYPIAGPVVVPFVLKQESDLANIAVYFGSNLINSSVLFVLFKGAEKLVGKMVNTAHVEWLQSWLLTSISFSMLLMSEDFQNNPLEAGAGVALHWFSCLAICLLSHRLMNTRSEGSASLLSTSDIPSDTRSVIPKVYYSKGKSAGERHGKSYYFKPAPDSRAWVSDETPLKQREEVSTLVRP